VNVLVLRKLDAGQLSDLSALLARCEQADGSPPLAEPQRMALSQPDGTAGLVVLLAYDGPALVGCAVLTPGSDGATALHVAVDPSRRGATRGWPIQRELIQDALSWRAEEGPGRLRLWIMGATGADDAGARQLGFRPERDLLQMRVPLPLPPDVAATARPLRTRAFRPGQDDEAWLAVNNRAFEGHPEQGGWTLGDLHERMAADWFDPDGFLVVDSADGTMIGSCWTKVHRDSTPVLGEIYVISVDPSHHGEGWGRALTVAGLQWMAGRGIGDGMLYTTSSNTTAVKLYHSLGFTIDHVDRSYLG
jgi:mycothiol synthase